MALASTLAMRGANQRTLCGSPGIEWPSCVEGARSRPPGSHPHHPVDLDSPSRWTSVSNMVLGSMSTLTSTSTTKLEAAHWVPPREMWVLLHGTRNLMSFSCAFHPAVRPVWQVTIPVTQPTNGPGTAAQQRQGLLPWSTNWWQEL